MKPPVLIDGLEIVGYATVLLDTMLPSVVPPVFRLKGNPGEALVPPYFFNAGCLYSATALSASELTVLEQKGEITLFAGKPLEARPDFELWVDQARHCLYEPRAEAHAALLALANGYIQKAEQALRDGKTANAERFSTVALCADDRLVEPLAIKAALRRLRPDPTGEGLMAKLAAPRMTAGAFGKLVDAYCSVSAPARAARPPTSQPLAHSSSGRPMYRIAARPA